MNATAQRALLVGAVVTVGTFAAVLFAVSISVSPSLQLLGGPEYTVVKQAQIRVFQVAMTLISTAYTIFAAAILYAQRQARGGPLFRLTLIALVLIVVALIYSGPTDIAYNQQILGWSPTAPPTDWAATRDAWDFSNTARMFPSMLAFILQTTSLLYAPPKP